MQKKTEKKKWYQATAADVMGIKKKNWRGEIAKQSEARKKQSEKRLKQSEAKYKKEKRRIKKGKLTSAERKAGWIILGIIILIIILLLALGIWLIWKFGVIGIIWKFIVNIVKRLF